MLKMLVVPLVFASIYTALTGLGSAEKLKNIGFKTIGLYLITTALAYAQAAEVKPFSFHEIVMSFIPSNVFNSLASGYMMQVIVFAVF
ncbi:MAG: cation:dicarboxylase symporter family transporter [Campylobacterales bacterium]|nr:cation:dicarboxylase symporter family transporter [Campylobacterales bacterium]